MPTDPYRLEAYEPGPRDVHHVVHPGFGPADLAASGADWSEDAERELRAHWQDYVTALGDVLDRGHRAGDAVTVLHPGDRDYAARLVDAHTAEPVAPTYVETYPMLGKVPRGRVDRLRAALRERGPDGTVYVHGELNWQCPDAAYRQALRTVDELMAADVARGVLFPPDPL